MNYCGLNCAICNVITYRPKRRLSRPAVSNRLLTISRTCSIPSVCAFGHIHNTAYKDLLKGVPVQLGQTNSHFHCIDFEIRIIDNIACSSTAAYHKYCFNTRSLKCF